MIIITVDGERHQVKYKQNAERVKVQSGTSANNYPDFVGSKMSQNSSSSDIYSLTFAINRSIKDKFKESFKKFVTNEEDAINDNEYGKLTHIIIVHPTDGAIKGAILGDVEYDTSGVGEIKVRCVFQVHTEDEPAETQDLEEENEEALNAIDDEISEGEFEEADRPALLAFLEALNALYDSIQNSAIVAAFNDLKSAINDAILNYQKVMNAVKKVLSLATDVADAIGDFKRQLDFIKDQAEVIKNIPAATFNLARFNINCMSYNLGIGNRIPFQRKAELRNKTGVKVAPI